MNVLSGVVLFAMVAVVLYLFAARITGGTPSVFGYYVFRVSSDSMEPTLAVGDVILVKYTPAEDIHIDDIITFKSEESQTYGREVTHRVILEPENRDGTFYFQTKGDAPKASLDRVITYDQVRGKYIRKLIVIGKLYGFLSQPIGVVVLLGLILLLFGYELVALMVSNKKIEDSDEALFATLDEKLNRAEKETKIDKEEKNIVDTKEE